MTSFRPESESLARRPGGCRFRFTLATLMLVSLVVSVTAAGGHYIRHGVGGPENSQASRVIALLILPALLVITVNLVRLTAEAWSRRAKRRGRLP